MEPIEGELLETNTWRDKLNSLIKVRDLLWFFIGVGITLYISMQVWDWKMGEIVQVGGMVYNEDVYNVLPRP